MFLFWFVCCHPRPLPGPAWPSPPACKFSLFPLTVFTIHHCANATSCLSGTSYLPQGSVTPIKWGSSELDEMQFLCLSAGHFISQRISVLWSPWRSWRHSRYMASPFILWPHSGGWRRKLLLRYPCLHTGNHIWNALNQDTVAFGGASLLRLLPHRSGERLAVSLLYQCMSAAGRASSSKHPPHVYSLNKW